MISASIRAPKKRPMLTDAISAHHTCTLPTLSRSSSRCSSGCKLASWPARQAIDGSQIPGCADLVKDTAVPVVLVEAEKSALALTAWSERTGQKILPVGTGGAWGWRTRIGTKYSTFVPAITCFVSGEYSLYLRKWLILT